MFFHFAGEGLFCVRQSMIVINVDLWIIDVDTFHVPFALCILTPQCDEAFRFLSEVPAAPGLGTSRSQ
ncbi:hypothetical protein M3765_19410 [Streptomyces thermoviolaceus]|uniref:Uncharacterized protein n=1 Tax=Streptomyces thermoviolaceus subsp. thermoviolaceus TaxID=66860 RepID=A0ABX0Z044_STRTL|nr:hypothetical protein [Streptomyces thermoviolaceus]MCM3266145.1 hypothetical protein [Streptomyces thermoviolaceus]NJP17534.1 hypothetical protein [Streptomyces thermoviolaceus subsp. thermoviolaceus]